jgi:glycerol-3-phosphate acyltransferase PlsY
MTLAVVLWIACAYLLGSIPFSQLVAHWRASLDLRNVGDGNTGARNVWHMIGPGWSVLAFSLDALKGLVAFRGAITLGLPQAGVLLAGVAAMLGHQFPIFLHGRGGKGMATAFGVLLGLTALSTLVGIGILGLLFLITRDFNPSVTIGSIAIVFLPLLTHQPRWVTLYAIVLAVLVGLKKLLDHPYEKAIWSKHPWEGPARPDWP